jgi:hypothetical protein
MYFWMRILLIRANFSIMTLNSLRCLMFTRTNACLAAASMFNGINGMNYLFIMNFWNSEQSPIETWLLYLTLALLLFSSLQNKAKSRVCYSLSGFLSLMRNLCAFKCAWLKMGRISPCRTTHASNSILNYSMNNFLPWDN